MGNTMGRLFRVTTWGESHGPGLGAAIDGCPPGLALAAGDIQTALDRRRPGQSHLTTQRKESDRVQIVSGVADGLTTGTSIGLWVPNEDARSKDYSEMARAYRPSHADYTYQVKYGIRTVEGGGRASARETVSRVAAGAIAAKVLARHGMRVTAWVKSVGTIEAPPGRVPSREEVDATPVRCPDEEAARAMIEAIEGARKAGNSLGGVVELCAQGVPPGLGSPVFDKLEADLAKAMLSIPAAKGFEVGSGFAGTQMTGSEHNDLFYADSSGHIRTRTNHSGGIQGGISNGEDIVLRVAFKPTATILLPQETIGTDGQPTVLKARGRHDPCVLPRAVPIVEAMAVLVLVDHWLLHRGQVGT